MTIVLISSGVGRAKEDSFDMQQLLISTCFSPFVPVGTERQLTTYVADLFRKMVGKQTHHFSFGRVGREHSSYFAMKQAIYNSIKLLILAVAQIVLEW